MARKTKITSSYLNRKTYADNIIDNFAKYNRRGYYQRIIFIAKNKVPPNIVKKTIVECVRKTNENLTNEILTGFCLYYTTYSIYMIEGLEDIIGAFMQNIVSITDVIFEISYILIVINNIRKILFTKFTFRTAEPPTVLEKFYDDDENASQIQQGIIITRFLALCREINSQSIGEQNEFLSADYTRVLISTQRIEFVLATNKNMFELPYYLESFRHVPTVESYDELVWPIPYDYTPVDIFKKEKYDVNLTFPDEEKR